MTGPVFSIPKLNEYNRIETHVFKVNELKEIAKYYKLKRSGKKSVLEERIVGFMKSNVACRYIQKIWRNYILRKFREAKGPAYRNPKICVNDTDFISLDSLAELPEKQFFSYQDASTRQIYGFDIKSLYLLFLKGGANIGNPYTRQPFPDNVKRNMQFIIRHAEMCDESIDIEGEPHDDISDEKRQEMRVLDLFQRMDLLGNYTDHRWFLSLGRIGLIKFIRELADIWGYRAQLTNETKRCICPPIGQPFRTVNLLTLPNLSIFELKVRAVFVMDQLITRGIDETYQGLGANYVLCALTLVNRHAAECLPWLYESVV